MALEDSVGDDELIAEFMREQQQIDIPEEDELVRRLRELQIPNDPIEIPSAHPEPALQKEKEKKLVLS